MASAFRDYTINPLMSVDPNDYLFGGGSGFGSYVAQQASLPSTNAPINIPGIGSAISAAFGGKTPNISSGKAGAGTPFTDKANLALSGLQTIGNLWSAFQMNKLANKQFNYTKDVTETNLANQIKSYNTALEDRARSRGFVEGQSTDQTQAYIDQNRLSRNRA